MKLTLSTPGSVPQEIKGNKDLLIRTVRGDAIARGATPDQLQRTMYGIGRPVHGVHAAVLADKDGYMVASYRIIK